MPVSARLICQCLAATTVFAAIAGTGQAQAANFGVSLTANAFNACNVNIGSDGCGVIVEPGSSGATSFGPGSDSSLATTATATSSYESFPSWQHTAGHTLSSATSAADLSTASLHLTASGANLNSNTGYEGSASAFAKLWDTLHFSVAGATADTLTTIGVTFTIKGQLGSSGTGANSELYGALSLGGYNFGANFGFQNNTNQTGNKTIANGLSIYSGSWTSNGDYTSNVLSGNYVLKGSTVDVLAQLQATLVSASGGGGQYGLGDFGSNGNGLALSFQLPSNVTLTSDSGAFLSAVPEPQGFALALAGMGVIGLARRNRKAH